MNSARPRPPALFARYPALEPEIPWIPLDTCETPVDPVRIAGTETIWVKRDDRSAERYGGNKVRKLEFVLGEALHRGAGWLVTGGALGSHHALATSVYGHHLGLSTTAVLCPQEVTPHVRSVVAVHAGLGTHLHLVPRMELIPPAMALARVRHLRRRAFVVPPGGSSVAGTLGFVSAALELADQIEAGVCPAPGAVYTPAGTLGTTAGLAIGLRLAGLRCSVVAVRVVGRLVTNRRALRSLVRRTLRRLREAGIGTPRTREVLRGVEWRDDQAGRGYGLPTPEGADASARFSEVGVSLDPTYTAKAAAALLADAAAGRPGPLLFWHTLSACEPPPHPDPGAVLPPEIAARTGWKT